MDPGPLVYRERVAYRRLRRATDLALCMLLLAVAIPIIILACIAIKAEDGGPLFFKQRRVGRFERAFTIYKLRTMRMTLCADQYAPGSDGDARITKVGRFLRRTSIDEIPQLFNVLRGDMSLVGPRPEMPFVVAGYERWQHIRHLASPGITCIWQITCRKTVPLHLPEATLMDVEYIKSASPVMDGILLFKTIGAVMRPKGAF